MNDYTCIDCGNLEPHPDDETCGNWIRAQILAGSIPVICYADTEHLLEITGLEYEMYWEDGEWDVAIHDAEYASVFENSARIIHATTDKPIHLARVVAAYLLGVNLGELDDVDVVNEIAPEIQRDVDALVELFPANYSHWEL